MSIKRHSIYAAALATGLLAASTAHATNGYFSIGYGAKSRGVVGASTALPQDTMAAAINPAGMAVLEEGADINVEWFSPIREAQSNFAGFPLRQESDMNGFVIPSGGYVRKLNSNMNFGLTVYANGGMNTQYDNSIVTPFGNIALFGAPTKTGVDLAQLIFAPSISMNLGGGHSVGAAALIGYQRFKAYGLQNFCGLKFDGTCNPFTGAGIGSKAANKGLTNQGYDDAWGAGVRIGWLGQVSPNVTIGAAYASKVYMAEFDKYDRLFAEQGDFDIPANYSVGIAVKATPKTTVSMDVQRIQYSGVKSISNHGPSLGLCPTAPFCEGQTPLGNDNGLGFGWDDMTIFKLGVVYEESNQRTWRFGISHGSQPIGKDELAFNILAPAVIETHVSFGFSYRPTGKAADGEWTLTYMHGVENTEEGAFPMAFGGSGASNETMLQMYQHAVEIGYAWNF